MFFLGKDKKFFLKLEVFCFLVWFFWFLEVIYEVIGILFKDKCLFLFKFFMLFKDMDFVLCGL